MVLFLIISVPFTVSLYIEQFTVLKVVRGGWWWKLSIYIHFVLIVLNIKSTLND